MAERVPYLERSRPTATGPEPLLEAPLVAWQAAVHLRAYPASGRFLAVWRELLPEACSVGRELHEDRTLDSLAETGASAESAWQTLVDIASRRAPD